MTLTFPILHTRTGYNPWQHLAFWLVTTGLVTVNILMSPGGGALSPLLTARIALHLLCFAAAVYFNLKVLVPRLLDKQRFIAFLLAFILTAIATAFVMYHGNIFLREQVFGGGVPLGPQGHGPGGNGFGPPAFRGGLPGKSNGFGSNAKFRPPFAKLMLVWSIQAMIVTGLALLLHLINALLRLKESEQRILEAEITALKAQLSPHFIFNSLNNIYSLSLAKSELAPDYTIKLSKITRYILREINHELISLDQELAFIRDYIALERIRLKDRANISLEVKGDPNGHQIAPLILLPFIENIFKHGVNPDPDQADVRIIVEIKDSGEIKLSFTNTLLADTEPPLENATGGVGLSNVRRRLKLLYPGIYDLNITEGPQHYITHLRLGT
ncbi:histidine kinase [Kiritimatiellaeota bacterium B1221]|nr:histidine kinase [Kiritimatiellaeota bacterium B1221]